MNGGDIHAGNITADDTCPRCGGGFHCGVNDASPCACTTLTLSDALLADLRERYGARCLCMPCLAVLHDAGTQPNAP